MSANYKPVTVEAAVDLALRFEKSIVIIIAWDDRHQRTHFTSYGRTAEQKVFAAEACDQIATVFDVKRSECEQFEDFRVVEASTWAVEREKLYLACKAAHHALNGVIACRDGITDDLLTEVALACEQALKPADKYPPRY